MPVKYSVTIQHISEDEFYLLDHRVMELVFSIHNNFGRLYDEKIYQNELAYLCQKMGIETATEIPIHVSYKDFIKLYYMDILVNHSVIYELKTVQALTGEHQKQVLNYLLLMGVHNGKIINMRTQSVQYRFVSTKLTPEKRYRFTIDDREWKDLDEDSIWLKQLVASLLSEWGAFLGTNLFYDAIKHFRGGEKNVVKRIQIMNDSRVLGTQKAHLLNSEIAFTISAVTKDSALYEQHLRRFLSHTSLKAIQLINFNHDKIVFSTISQ